MHVDSGYDDEDGQSVTPNENVIRVSTPEGGGEEIEHVHCDEQGHSPGVLRRHDQLGELADGCPSVQVENGVQVAAQNHQSPCETMDVVEPFITITQKAPDNVILLRQRQDQGDLGDGYPRRPSCIKERTGVVESGSKQNDEVQQQEVNLRQRVSGEVKSRPCQREQRAEEGKHRGNMSGEKKDLAGHPSTVRYYFLGEFGIVSNNRPRRVVSLHRTGSRHLPLLGPNPAEDLAVAPFRRSSKEANEVGEAEDDGYGD